MCIYFVFRSRQHSAILWIHPSRHFRGSGSWYVQHLHLPLSISLKFLVRACLFPSPNTTPDATGKPWEYLDGRAVRNPGILEPKPVFDIEEWTIAKNISDINVYLPFIYDQGTSTCNGNVRAEENGNGLNSLNSQKGCRDNIDRACERPIQEPAPPPNPPLPPQPFSPPPASECATIGCGIFSPDFYPCACNTACTSFDDWYGSRGGECG